MPDAGALPLFSPALINLLGPARQPDAPIEARHRNLAFATQAVYEQAFFHLLHTLQRRNGHTAVALAGGCAYNSVANGKITDRTGFTKSYLQAAAGDAGGAIGAAYAVWHAAGARTSQITHAFWGPKFSNDELAALLVEHRAALESEGCSVQTFDDDNSRSLPQGRDQPTYFNWKKKYDGLLPSEMRRLKQLEDENSKLRKVVADLSLDKEMLQDALRRKL